MLFQLYIYGILPTALLFTIPLFWPNAILSIFFFSQAAKGQLILKANSKLFIWTKKPTKLFLKFMFFKKATKFDEIFTVDLTLCSKCQIDGEDFVNFCGFLRKHELYYHTL